MKVNYANNPLLGPGKWDPLLSLLTPSGDAIVIPTNLIEAIKSRARVLKSRGIAVFRTVKLQDGSFSLRRLSGNQRRGNFELYEKIKSMQVGAMQMHDAMKKRIKWLKEQRKLGNTK